MGVHVNKAIPVNAQGTNAVEVNINDQYSIPITRQMIGAFARHSIYRKS